MQKARQNTTITLKCDPMNFGPKNQFVNEKLDLLAFLNELEDFFHSFILLSGFDNVLSVFISRRHLIQEHVKSFNASNAQLSETGLYLLPFFPSIFFSCFV